MRDEANASVLDWSPQLCDWLWLWAELLETCNVCADTVPAHTHTCCCCCWCVHNIYEGVRLSVSPQFIDDASSWVCLSFLLCLNHFYWSQNVSKMYSHTHTQSDSKICWDTQSDSHSMYSHINCLTASPSPLLHNYGTCATVHMPYVYVLCVCVCYVCVSSIFQVSREHRAVAGITVYL